MTTPIAAPLVHLAPPASAQRDALCAHAVRVLHTTAQQWGMRMQPSRKPVAEPPCAGLQRMRGLGWAMPV